MEVDEDKITAKSLEAVDRALKDRLSEEEQERHKQELQNMQRSHIEELKRDRESQKAEMQKLNDKIAGLLQGLSETNERAKELSDENNSLKQKLEKVPILGRGQEIELLKQLESVSPSHR